MSPFYTCVPKNNNQIIYGFSDTRWDVFHHFGPFSDLLPTPMDPENNILQKMKDTWRYCLFANVYHWLNQMIVWLLVLWSATDRFFCHFRSFELEPSAWALNLSLESEPELEPWAWALSLRPELEHWALAFNNWL